jgi:hypothetical protein
MRELCRKKLFKPLALLSNKNVKNQFFSFSRKNPNPNELNETLTFGFLSCTIKTSTYMTLFVFFLY